MIMIQDGKIQKPQEPSFYRVALDCHHQAIMTPSEIKASLVEELYDPVTGTRQPVIVCPECKEHKPG
jgi:hypothetical protein